MEFASEYFSREGSGLFCILVRQFGGEQANCTGLTSHRHKRRRKITATSDRSLSLTSTKQKSGNLQPDSNSNTHHNCCNRWQALAAAAAAVIALQQAAREVQHWAHSSLLNCNRPATAFASLNLSFKGGSKGGAGSLPGPHDADLPRIFAELDVDKRGYLCIENLRVALSRVGLPCGHDYLASLMKQYDANHDGKVDLQEFQDYVAHRQRDMAHAFDTLDVTTDGQHLGCIDTDTLVHVLKKAGLSAASADDAHHMINLLDKDHDGVISYDEFCRFACLLPAAQISHNNTLTCWADSADWIAHMEYRLSMLPPKSARDRLVAGGLAGAISRTCVAPFERLRTIMMTSSGISFPDAVRTMWADNGILGLWRGNLLTVAKTIPASAIQFAAYDGTKDFLMAAFPRHHKAEESLSQLEKMFAGGVAGAAAILVTYPLETLRTRMSIAGGASSLSTCISQIWQTQGPRGFYQGLRTGLCCEILSTGLGFVFYEQGQAMFRDLHDGRSPSPRERGFIGGFSALFVMAATMPLEVIQRRLQVQGHPGRPVIFNSAMHCFQTILKTEGWQSFYRGMLASFMKVGPSIGATYALYALLVQKWGIGGIRPYNHLPSQEEAAFATGSPQLAHASKAI